MLTPREREELVILHHLLRVVEGFLIYPNAQFDGTNYVNRMREIVLEHRTWKSAPLSEERNRGKERDHT